VASAPQGSANADKHKIRGGGTAKFMAAAEDKHSNVTLALPPFFTISMDKLI
jgi:hypothetical protein